MATSPSCAFNDNLSRNTLIEQKVEGLNSQVVSAETSLKVDVIHLLPLCLSNANFVEQKSGSHWLNSRHVSVKRKATFLRRRLRALKSLVPNGTAIF